MSDSVQINTSSTQTNFQNAPTALPTQQTPSVAQPQNVSSPPSTASSAPDNGSSSLLDILLAETVFDTLNLKAAIFAIEHFFDEYPVRLPIMLSVTITDASGRTLSGQKRLRGEAC